MANRSLNYNNLTPGATYLIKGRASVYDVVEVIQDIARQNSQSDVIKNIAKELKNKGGDTLKNIFDYAYKNIVFQPDVEDEQNLRTVYNMMREKKGNCTSYSTLISSLLLSLNISHHLRTVGYTKPRMFEHIYVVTDDGTILDPVIGQRQDGTDNEYNRNGGYYDKEVPYLTKKDFPMKLNVLNGTRTNKILSGCGCGCAGDCGKLGFIRGRRRSGILNGDGCGGPPGKLWGPGRMTSYWQCMDRSARAAADEAAAIKAAADKAAADKAAAAKAAADKAAIDKKYFDAGLIPPGAQKESNLLKYVGIAIAAYSLFK